MKRARVTTAPSSRRPFTPPWTARERDDDFASDARRMEEAPNEDEDADGLACAYLYGYPRLLWSLGTAPEETEGDRIRAATMLGFAHHRAAERLAAIAGRRGIDPGPIIHLARAYRTACRPPKGVSADLMYCEPMQSPGDPPDIFGVMPERLRVRLSADDQAWVARGEAAMRRLDARIMKTDSRRNDVKHYKLWTRLNQDQRDILRHFFKCGATVDKPLKGDAVRASVRRGAGARVFQESLTDLVRRQLLGSRRGVGRWLTPKGWHLADWEAKSAPAGLCAAQAHAS